MNSSRFDKLLKAENLEKTLNNGWQSYFSVQGGNEAVKALKYEEAEKCFRIVVAETEDTVQYVSAIGGLILMASSVDEASGLQAKGLAKIDAWFSAIESPSAEEKNNKTVLVFEMKDRYADFYYPIDPDKSKEMSSVAVEEARREAGVDASEREHAGKI